MQTISVSVQDDLVKLCDLESLKKNLEEELEYQGFHLLEKKIQKAMSEVDVDWEMEFEKKREEAFEEYRHRGKGN